MAPVEEAPLEAVLPCSALRHAPPVEVRVSTPLVEATLRGGGAASASLRSRASESWWPSDAGLRRPGEALLAVPAGLGLGLGLGLGFGLGFG